MSANDNRHTGRRKGLWLWTIVLFLVLFGFGGIAAFHFQDQLLPPGAVTAAEARSIDGDTPFHDHVAQAGMTSCFESFPSMGQLLTQNAQYTVQSQWTGDEAEGGSISAVVGMEFETPQYSGPAIGYVFAAPVGDSCAGGMVRVTPFAENCNAVAQRFLPESTPEAELQGLPAYAVADGSQIVIMPIGENCVAVSVGAMIEG